MRHYILPDNYDGSGKMELSGNEFHYLTHVLRIRPGESFSGVDTEGNRVSIRLQSSHSGRCILEIERGDTQTGSSERADAPLHITLFQCVPKGNKMDLIVRQAVEAGVETVVPVQSENSIPRLNDDNFDKKRQRWLRIARQAMQQCGRRNVPVITPPVAVSEVSKLWNENAGPADICLFFHEKSLGQGGLHDLLSGGPQAVGICVGPEGGFSPGEVTGLLKSGLQPVYINTNVLRSETAALYAVAAVQTIILERTSWNLRQ